MPARLAREHDHPQARPGSAGAGRGGPDLTPAPPEVWAPDVAGIASAAAAVREGKVIGVPTDTVYGVACSATDLRAIEQLYSLKVRPQQQPLILMAATAAEIWGFAEPSPLAERLARQFWPGPLTLVLPSLPLGAALRGRGTLGVRIPATEVTLELLRRTGPLATTSANIHGQDPALDASSAARSLPRLSGVLAASSEASASDRPSSILDLTREQPVLLREGRLSARQLGVPVPGQEPGTRRD
ncbi:MAG TPA: L-threonylcarbamoyladenylate synthase [Candidatus Dormibacteraeota bacterium]